MRNLETSLFVIAFGIIGCEGNNKPNIILIVADDLGWNDVSYHGSNEIPTPNIDALAYNGIILNKHYVLPVCTPSRAALMTGKYPIRTGMQEDPLKGSVPWTLPKTETLLPQYLKNYGYITHLVGKWHLGFYETKYTPTARGFDSHFGYFNGWIRYNDSVCTAEAMIGIDARRNLDKAGDEFEGKYATDVFTDEAVKIIENHDPNKPLFLEVAHAAVHALKSNILQVENVTENDHKFEHIKDPHRRLYAGMVSSLDDSVGRIMEALNEYELLNNSIVLFMSDNGGATEDPIWNFKNSASNWPLRGMKTSFHEGGVRGAAAIWSPLLRTKNIVSNDLIHITDWLPTFVAGAAGGALESGLNDLDGINQWEYLFGSAETSDRNELLVNINHKRQNYAIIEGKYKLLTRNTSKESFADLYAGESGRNYSINTIKLALQSETNKIINSDDRDESIFRKIREEANIDSFCTTKISDTDSKSPVCGAICLFDLDSDPCESTDISSTHQHIVLRLSQKLEYFDKEVVDPQVTSVDPRSNPDLWGGYWTPWLDINSSNSSTIVTLSIIVVTLVIVSKYFNVF